MGFDQPIALSVNNTVVTIHGIHVDQTRVRIPSAPLSLFQLIGLTIYAYSDTMVMLTSSGGRYGSTIMGNRYTGNHWVYSL